MLRNKDNEIVPILKGQTDKWRVPELWNVGCTDIGSNTLLSARAEDSHGGTENQSREICPSVVHILTYTVEQSINYFLQGMM